MKRILFLLALIVGLSVATPVVIAQEAPAPTPATVPAEADQAQTTGGQETPTFRPPASFGYVSPVRNVTIPGFISRVISFALGIVGAIFLVMLIYGGFQWMTAGSQFSANGTAPGKSASQVSNAKTTLKNAVIGMMIVALSYTIVTAVFTLGNQVIEGVQEVQEDDTQVQGSGQSECPPGESLHPEQGCINRIW
jgi:hypothetical protein